MTFLKEKLLEPTSSNPPPNISIVPFGNWFLGIATFDCSFVPYCTLLIFLINSLPDFKPPLTITFNFYNYPNLVPT